MSGWAAAAQAASSLAGSYLQYKGQKKTNAANREMVAMANAFTERMSNSAYQRAMADMKKAGLNPILAYQQGGAQTPQSAMLSMQLLSSSSAVKYLSPDMVTILSFSVIVLSASPQKSTYSNPSPIYTEVSAARPRHQRPDK